MNGDDCTVIKMVKREGRRPGYNIESAQNLK